MRYARQIIFKKIGRKGQHLLEKSSVIVVGCGATGSRAAELLTRAGIGKIRVIDRDFVEEDNLQRQTLFIEKDFGKAKAQVVEKRLKEINSSIKIKGLVEDLNQKNVVKLLKNCDLVLDCTDNLKTRFVINEFCVKNKIPWIYSAVVGSSGATLNITPTSGFCFKCVFKKVQCGESCRTHGIINTAPSAIVAVQVTEAIKILTKQKSSKELLHLDLWNQRLTKIKVKKNPDCSICKT